MDRGLNDLLKWSIENSAANTTHGADPQEQAGDAHRPPNMEAMAALLGGPSDAELMQASMEVITSTDASVSLEDKLVAFDNFEQLIEQLDNANNMANLSLWTPLLSMLEHDESDLRRMAAWTVGTAVQNNQPSQERLLAMGGIPKLVTLAAKEGETEGVRRKAIYALSSAVRNYQPAMDVFTDELGQKGLDSDKTDASNMDAVDNVMKSLRDHASKAAPN